MRSAFHGLMHGFPPGGRRCRVSLGQVALDRSCLRVELLSVVVATGATASGAAAVMHQLQGVATASVFAARVGAAIVLGVGSTQLRGQDPGSAASSRPEQERVGAVGFCMGGGFVLVLAAQQGEKIGAAVPFYGVLGEDYPSFANLSAASVAGAAAGQST